MQTISMAIKAISGNKARSLLTMLGVIIGVLSVVVLVAIGQGATSSVTDSISSLGSNLITVNIMTRRIGWGGPNQRSNRQSGAKGTVILRLDELEELAENVETIDKMSPTVSGQLTVKAGNVSETASVQGVLPAYGEIIGQGVSDGRYIIDADVDNRSAVCVMGCDLAEDLFGTTDVVGDSVYVDGRKFRIVGILESKGTSMSGSSDESIVIPFTLAQRMLASTNITSVYFSATSAETVYDAEDAIESFLYKKYKDDSSYNVTNMTSILDTVSEMTGTLTLMLAGISGISLLVGGIGIMNIMLVSVTERTREIGIRKAIGAKRGSILLQFLIESVVISGMGGIIGLALSYVVMFVLGNALNMSLKMSMSVALLAIAFSMGVGVIFGIYPANKASKLRPIEALHYS